MTKNIDYKIKECDERGNTIHFIDVLGYECWQGFDERNRMIHSKDSVGLEFWYEYDERNNEIYYKFTRDSKLICEYWRKYDERDNKIYYRDSCGFESFLKYNKMNKIIYYTSNVNHRRNSIYKYWDRYDKKGNLIYHKDSKGFKYWKEYDERNNCIYHEDYKGSKYRYKYNENNQITNTIILQKTDLLANFTIQKLFKFIKSYESIEAKRKLLHESLSDDHCASIDLDNSINILSNIVMYKNDIHDEENLCSIRFTYEETEIISDHKIETFADIKDMITGKVKHNELPYDIRFKLITCYQVLMAFHKIKN